MIRNESLRSKVNRELDRPVSDDEWRLLDAQGVLRRDIDPSGIAETVKQFRRAFSRQEVAVPMLDRGGELTPARVHAISELVARHASEDARVQGFRSRRLPNGLLEFERIEAWISTIAKADGKPSQYSTVVASAATRKCPDVGISARYLCYGSPASNFVRNIPVAHNGVLDELRGITEILSKRYGWQPAQATLFVLTGVPPLVSTLRVKATTELFPVLRKIVLTVDPALSPRELAEHYKTIRRRFLGERHRAMSEKHCTLVLFMQDWPANETYSSAMGVWNKKFPTWRYRHATNFGRDVLAARKRLLGSGLDVFASSRVQEEK